MHLIDIHSDVEEVAESADYEIVVVACDIDMTVSGIYVLLCFMLIMNIVFATTLYNSNTSELCVRGTIESMLIIYILTFVNGIIIAITYVAKINIKKLQSIIATIIAA